jgi:beta-phosphoglucomutase family hydrolase
MTACLFDLDGVLTKTAVVHARAWKQMFDAFLQERAAKTGDPFVPFDEVKDYDVYVDGKARQDGVLSFLESRHIVVPTDTVHELGKQKDQMFLQLIHADGVEAYEGSVRYVHASRDAGLKLAVVSASKNCTEVLRAAKLDGLFDAQVDGNVAEAKRLRGKPAPDTYLAAANMLRIKAQAAAVFEDALAGVEAGRAGKFGIVIGVDREGQAGALRKHGADIVVSDLADLLGRK